MSPTLPIANVAPPPARGGDTAHAAPGSGEATRSATGSNEATRGGDDDFAHALSHAQRPRKPTHEPPPDKGAKAAKAAGQPAAQAAPRGHAAPAEPAQGTAADALKDSEANPLRDTSADADARCGESLLDAARAAVDGDANARPAQGDETPKLPISPVVASDSIVPSCALVVPRDTVVASDATSVAAIDGDGKTERAAPHGTGHDRRARAGTDRNPAALQSAPGDQATATAQPLRTAPERQAADATAVTATAARAPSFDAKVAHDASPLPPWHAAAALRDAGATAVSSPESLLPHARVHAAIDDAAFGSALGHQVALWVRDGVQEARLHLHPAELGPVAVQIALDGQSARVDFTAPVAATRDSIEQSLPALAAALRESGFTLTGGGVSAQAGHSGANGGAPRGRAATTSGDRSRSDGGFDGSGALAAPRRLVRSLLDVYA